MKKAINIIKDIEPEKNVKYNLSPEDKRKIKMVLDRWEESSKFELKNLIKKLRKS